MAREHLQYFVLCFLTESSSSLCSPLVRLLLRNFWILPLSGILVPIADSSLWAPFLTSSHSWYKPIPVPASWLAGLVHPSVPHTSLRTGIWGSLCFFLPLQPRAVPSILRSTWLLRPGPARVRLIPSPPLPLLPSFCPGEVRHSRLTCQLSLCNTFSYGEK